MLRPGHGGDLRAALQRAGAREALQVHTHVCSLLYH